MKLNKKIIVIGDSHGEWVEVNKIIDIQKPDILISVGDFGYFPNIKEYDLSLLNTKNTKIIFCDGNHEDHHALKKLNYNNLPFVQVYENIIWQTRGSLIKIDGLTFCFFGGAESSDKHSRYAGDTWFPEESISQRDILNFYEFMNEDYNDIDVMITHVPPVQFEINYREDSSRKALQSIYKLLTPKIWIFGHYHRYMTGTHDKTYWIGLSKVPGPDINFIDIESTLTFYEKLKLYSPGK